MTESRPDRKRPAEALYLPAAALLLWFAVTSARLVNPYLLPSPGTTFGTLAHMLMSRPLYEDMLASLSRWAGGYVTGCIAGVPIGLWLGRSPALYRAAFPSIDFLRSLPVTALFPLFLLLFGIGDGSKMAMAFTATVFVVILNSASGAAQTSRTRLRAAEAFGATPWQRFRHITFWEALPQTLIGMRTALSLALIVVIVSEMFIGTEKGLGQRIYDEYSFNLTAGLYAIVLVTGFLGFAMNRIFLRIEKRLVFWTGQ